jgi:hypothetical protein
LQRAFWYSTRRLRQEDLLDPAANLSPVTFPTRCGLDGQAALIEIGQERRPGVGQGNERHSQEQRGREMTGLG